MCLAQSTHTHIHPAQPIVEHRFAHLRKEKNIGRWRAEHNWSWMQNVDCLLLSFIQILVNWIRQSVVFAAAHCCLFKRLRAIIQSRAWFFNQTERCTLYVYAVQRHGRWQFLDSEWKKTELQIKRMENFLFIFGSGERISLRLERSNGLYGCASRHVRMSPT